MENVEVKNLGDGRIEIKNVIYVSESSKRVLNEKQFEEHRSQQKCIEELKACLKACVNEADDAISPATFRRAKELTKER